MSRVAVRAYSLVRQRHARRLYLVRVLDPKYVMSFLRISIETRFMRAASLANKATPADRRVRLARWFDPFVSQRLRLRNDRLGRSHRCSFASVGDQLERNRDDGRGLARATRVLRWPLFGATIGELWREGDLKQPRSDQRRVQFQPRLLKKLLMRLRRGVGVPAVVVEFDGELAAGAEPESPTDGTLMSGSARRGPSPASPEAGGSSASR
jgi:hypothetical protein